MFVCGNQQDDNHAIVPTSDGGTNESNPLQVLLQHKKTETGPCFCLYSRKKSYRFSRPRFTEQRWKSMYLQWKLCTSKLGSAKFLKELISQFGVVLGLHFKDFKINCISEAVSSLVRINKIITTLPHLTFVLICLQINQNRYIITWNNIQHNFTIIYRFKNFLLHIRCKKMVQFSIEM